MQPYLQSCLVDVECVYEERSTLIPQGFLTQKMGEGSSKSFGYLNHQCCMGIPGRGCRMGIPDREYRMGIPDSIPVEETHTASYSKAFIALNVVIQKFHDFVLFSVFFFFLWFP